eukprot:CAMPEP_0202703920 /NCGR_PEP_ID=MMETSP1385-20130828/16708_1 /ASSEMBLY_ACC=CAM_ASM_000861 /TAXON_ID=933848 /ORGANISM="Elphidium margaritaceum" /LENGTH=392 /DNA_ID=CAMNT_0049361849 /DNA_START=28 /DNA_END=1206 /DNA_ORIENTATION=-
MEKDYYKILKVDKNATPEQIKKSFRKLALKWHPDKNPDNQDKAERRFKQIAEAYAVLTDPEKKRRYDQYGVSGTRQQAHGHAAQNNAQYFTFTEEDIEEIYRQFFKYNNVDNEDENKNENMQFMFEHLFHTKPPVMLTANAGIEQKPFRFYSKQIYFVRTDKNYNQRIDSYAVRHPFEKSNREYGREILEIVRYLLQSLPFQFGTAEGNENEYFLLKCIIDSQQAQSRGHHTHVFSTKCVELAQRLYNLRNHIAHWTRMKKQMSFKSVDHYMHVAKQFMAELQNHPHFQYNQFYKHFKVATLNLQILHQQFTAHKAKDFAQREKYGNVRKALDASYDAYQCAISTRVKWFVAGMVTTLSVLLWLIRNVDLDDVGMDAVEIDHEVEPRQAHKK